ncbi:MAG TPA: hypothetical protein VGM90_28825 [Kofleriaceae bacterium]|jgi:hypothetical protein
MSAGGSRFGGFFASAGSSIGGSRGGGSSSGSTRRSIAARCFSPPLQPAWLKGSNPEPVDPALHAAQPSMREIMIVADGAPTTTDHSFVVTTPLDAIVRLEKRVQVRTVVLAGRHARDPALVAFLEEFYPSLHVEREP